MFVGIISLSSCIHPRDHLGVDSCLAALCPYHKPDRVGILEDEVALLVETQATYSSPATPVDFPLRCPTSGVVVLFWGRLDNRSALALALDIDHQRLPTLSDAHLVLAAWQRWQNAMPERLLGDFALAVWNPANRDLFLARDPLGVKPLYYRLDGQTLLFTTTLAVFHTLKKNIPPPDVDWVARYLAYVAADPRKTSLVGVVKVPPGHRVMVDGQGRETVQPWFSWRDDPPAAKTRDPRWVEEYRVLLEEAVRCRMVGDAPLATENSGGLDSGAVTAYLAYLLGDGGDRLHVFGQAVYEQEPAYILEPCIKYKLKNIYLTSSFGELTDTLVDRSNKVMGQPAEFYLPDYEPFYQECRLRGVRTLFSGFGGDEVVTNFGRTLPYELLDAGHYRQLWDILPGNLYRRGRGLARMLIKGWKKRDYIPGYLASRQAQWSHRLLREDIVERLAIANDHFAYARGDAPYRRINDFILQDRLRYLNSGGRLENGSLTAASYGVEACWPLCDVRLIQHYLSTPSIEKMGPGGIGRYLHRRAIEGVVPHKVAWKPSKDMGYGNVSKEMEAIHLIKSTVQAERQDTALHPMLDALIDRQKFREQIQRAKQGGVDDGFFRAFLKSAHAIHFLNRWLHDVASV